MQNSMIDRHAACVIRLGICVCVSAALRIVSARRAASARRISLGGEGNALYPVLSSFTCNDVNMFLKMFNAKTFAKCCKTF